MKIINNLLVDIFQKVMSYECRVIFFKNMKNEKVLLICNIVKNHVEIILQTISYHIIIINM